MNSQKHPFHLVDPSPWPLFGSLGALASTMGGVMYMHSWGSWVEDGVQKLGLEQLLAGYWIGSIFCILFCKRSLLSLAFQTYIVSKNPLVFPLSLGSNNSTPQDIANIAAAIYSLSLTTFVIFFFLSIVLVSIWRNLLPEAKTQVKNSPYFVLLFTGLGFLFLVSCFLYSMSARLL